MTIEDNTPMDQGAMDEPAILVNRFNATLSQQGVRLALAEMFGPKSHPRYRGAFVMTPDDARLLAEMLLKMVGNRQEMN